ncbi:MAG: hypothetical protein ACI8Z7_000634 [Candidatus Nanohaloarchaea archaeon]|jgi:hypothetical protein
MGDSETSDRRTVLKGVGTIFAGVGLAGCSNNNSEQTPNPTPTVTSTDRSTETEKSTPTEEATPTEEPVKLNEDLAENFAEVTGSAGFAMSFDDLRKLNEDAVNSFIGDLYHLYGTEMGVDVKPETSKSYNKIRYPVQGETTISKIDFEIDEDETGKRLGSHRGFPIYEFPQQAGDGRPYIANDEEKFIVATDKMEEAKNIFDQILEDEHNTAEEVERALKPEIINSDTVAVSYGKPVRFSEWDYVTLNSQTDGEPYQRWVVDENDKIVEQAISYLNGEFTVTNETEPMPIEDKFPDWDI